MNLHPYFILSRTTQNFESYPSFKVFLFQFYEHIKYALTWESINFLCSYIVKNVSDGCKLSWKMYLWSFFSESGIFFSFCEYKLLKVILSLCLHDIDSIVITVHIAATKNMWHPSNIFELSHSSVILVPSEK